MNLDTLLSAALKNRETFDYLREALTSDLVVANPYQLQIARFAAEFVDNHNSLPRSGDWEMWIADLSEAQAAGVRQTFATLWGIDTSRYTDAFVSKEALEALQEVAASNALARMNALDSRPSPELYSKLAAQVEAITGSRQEFAVLASQYKIAPVEWLWEPYVPLGMLSIMEGDPEVGKSTLCAWIAGQVTARGNRISWRRGRALIASAEDTPEQVIVPRLMAAGADLDRVRIIPNPIDLTDAADLRELRHWIETWQPAVVIIDPISVYVGKTDTHRDSQVRQLLTPLGKFAEQYRCAIITTRHLRKSGAGKAKYMGLDSIGFFGAVRSVLHVMEREDDDGNPSGEYVIIHLKSNVGKKGKQLAYRIEDADVDADHLRRPIHVARPVFLQESPDVSHDEITGRRRRKTDADKAEDALVAASLPWRQIGMMPASVGAAALEEAGIKERTGRNARQALGWKAFKITAEQLREAGYDDDAVKTMAGASWWWQLEADK
jgi:hypothetical protein